MHSSKMEEVRGRKLRVRGESVVRGGGQGRGRPEARGGRPGAWTIVDWLILY